MLPITNSRAPSLRDGLPPVSMEMGFSHSDPARRPGRAFGHNSRNWPVSGSVASYARGKEDAAAGMGAADDDRSAKRWAQLCARCEM